MRRSIKRRFAVLMALIMMLSVTPMQTLTEGFIEFSIISNMSLTPGVYPTDGDQPADQLVDASTNEITNPRYVWLYTDGGVTYLYVSITLNTGNSVILFQVDGVNGSFVHTIGQNNDISVNNTPYNPNIKGNNNHWEVWRVPISSLVLDGSYSITIHTTEGQGHWLIGVPFHVAMSIDKTANKTQYSALGEIITYTVVLKNNGDQVLTGVTLADSLAPNVTVGSPTESILADGKFVPGETWTYTYTYAVTAEDLANGSILNRATADNDQMSPVYDEVTVTAAPKVNISGTKTWEDNDDQDGLRPDKITVNLLADGMEVDEAEVEAPWSYSFTGLPKYRDGGVEIVYTVTEDPITGYTPSVDGHDILNTHTPETTTRTVQKIWEDNGVEDTLHTEVQLELIATADGDLVPWATLKAASASGALMDADGMVTLGPDAPLTHVFYNLPVYYQGDAITYTVDEPTVPGGYEKSIDELVVTNTRELTDDIPVLKIWEDQEDLYGLRPLSVTIHLMRSDDAITPYKQLVLNEGNGWMGTFADLPAKDGNGEMYTYSIHEERVPGYLEPAYGGIEGTQTVTNTLDTIDIPVDKIWDDMDDLHSLRPDDVTVELLQNGAPFIPAQTKTLSAPAWNTVFEGLPRKDASDIEYVYTLIETPVTGYLAPAYDEGEGGLEVVNTVDLISISGQKIWDDGDNNDAMRPANITVRLMSGAVEIDNRVVTAANGWAFQFANLPRFDESGLIHYTITEDAISGYTQLPITQINAETGLESLSEEFTVNIINTHINETITLSGLKQWNHGTNTAVPAAITVRVMAGAEQIAAQTIGAPWTYSFTGLPKFLDGVLISYTITEDVVPGYTTSIDQANGLIINTFIELPPAPEVPGEPDAGDGLIFLGAPTFNTGESFH